MSQDGASWDFDVFREKIVVLSTYRCSFSSISLDLLTIGFVQHVSEFRIFNGLLEILKLHFHVIIPIMKMLIDPFFDEVD